MHRFTGRSAIDLLILLFGITGLAVILFKGEILTGKDDVASVAQEGQELRLMIPDAKWDRIVFEEINKRTTEANVPSLRTVVLAEDALEVRVWVSGESGMSGFILRRSANQWSALYLPRRYEQLSPPPYREVLAEPKSGWEAAWKRLVDAKILSLPDASELQCNAGIMDGGSFIVEINMNKAYRTYMYVGPKFANCEEAKQILTVGELISEEFGLEDFTLK